jgi:hypothetical protein
MESILLAGEDPELLACRANVLAIVTASITCCAPGELSSRLQTGAFDLIVLCSSVSPSRQRALAAAIHRDRPEIPILHLLSRFDRSSPDPSRRLVPVEPSPPASLAARTIELLQNSAPDRERVFLYRRPLTMTR